MNVTNNNEYIISDQNVIANEFNNYFINVNQMVIHCRDNMVLSRVTESEINKRIN